MKPMGEPADIRRQLAQLAAGLAGRRRRRRHLATEDLEAHDQRRQTLIDAVVELAGQAAALVLLGFEHVSRQAPDLFLLGLLHTDLGGVQRLERAHPPPDRGEEVRASVSPIARSSTEPRGTGRWPMRKSVISTGGGRGLSSISCDRKTLMPPTAPKRSSPSRPWARP